MRCSGSYGRGTLPEFIDFTVHASVRGKQRITVVIKEPTPAFKQIGLLPASVFHEGINLEESGGKRRSI